MNEVFPAIPVGVQAGELQHTSCICNQWHNLYFANMEDAAVRRSCGRNMKSPRHHLAASSSSNLFYQSTDEMCDGSALLSERAQPPDRRTIGNLSLTNVTWAAIFGVLAWMRDKANVGAAATEIHTCAWGGGPADNLLSLPYIKKGKTWPRL